MDLILPTYNVAQSLFLNSSGASTEYGVTVVQDCDFKWIDTFSLINKLFVNKSYILVPLYSKLLKFNVTDDILYLPVVMSIDSFNFGKLINKGLKYILPPPLFDISKLSVLNPE